MRVSLRVWDCWFRVSADLLDVVVGKGHGFLVQLCVCVTLRGVKVKDGGSRFRERDESSLSL